MKKMIFVLTSALLIASGAFAKKQAKVDLWSDLEEETVSSEAASPLDSEESVEISADEATASAKKAPSPLDDISEDFGEDSYEDEYWDEEDEDEDDYLVEVESNSNKNRLEMPHRIFELGYKLDAGVGNSYLNVNDYMVQDLVIDLGKFADEMPAQGLVFNMLMGFDMFMNLNLKNGVHVGFDNGLDFTGDFGIGKEIFDFIGHGNKIGSSIKATGQVYTDAFLHTEIQFGMNLPYGLHLEVAPALFRPLAHISSNDLKASIKNTEDGTVEIEANANLDVYTFLNLDNDKLGEISADAILNEVKNGWGFDIASSMERRMLDTLVVKAYSRIPIVPGRLNYKTTVKAGINGSVNGITELMNQVEKKNDASREGGEGSSASEGESSESSENDGNFFDQHFTTESTLTSGSANYSLSRPFRMGVEAAWEPFGSWCTFGGLLGFAFKEPFDPKAKGYMEYNLSCKVGLPVPVIGQIMFLKLSSGYLSESFVHQALFGLNFRALELNAGISAQGSSFAGSFKGSGVGAKVYIAFGW